MISVYLHAPLHLLSAHLFLLISLTAILLAQILHKIITAALYLRILPVRLQMNPISNWFIVCQSLLSLTNGNVTTINELIKSLQQVSCSELASSVVGGARGGEVRDGSASLEKWFADGSDEKVDEEMFRNDPLGEKISFAIIQRLFYFSLHIDTCKPRRKLFASPNSAA